MIPLNLIHQNLILLLVHNLKLAGVDERNDVVVVANSDLITIGRPSQVDIFA